MIKTIFSVFTFLIFSQAGAYQVKLNPAFKIKATPRQNFEKGRLGSDGRPVDLPFYAFFSELDGNRFEISGFSCDQIWNGFYQGLWMVLPTSDPSWGAAMIGKRDCFVTREGKTSYMIYVNIWANAPKGVPIIEEYVRQMNREKVLGLDVHFDRAIGFAYPHSVNTYIFTNDKVGHPIAHIQNWLYTKSQGEAYDLMNKFVSVGRQGNAPPSLLF